MGCTASPLVHEFTYDEVDLGRVRYHVHQPVSIHLPVNVVLFEPIRR